MSLTRLRDFLTGDTKSSSSELDTLTLTCLEVDGLVAPEGPAPVKLVLVTLTCTEVDLSATTEGPAPVWSTSSALTPDERLAELLLISFLISFIESSKGKLPIMS